MKQAVRLRARERLPTGTKRSFVDELQAYARSRAMPVAVREIIGRVLARLERVREDDLQVVLHLVRETTYHRATVEDVVDAASVAIWNSQEAAPLSEPATRRAAR